MPTLTIRFRVCFLLLHLNKQLSYICNKFEVILAHSKKSPNSNSNVSPLENESSGFF